MSGVNETAKRLLQAQASGETANPKLFKKWQKFIGQFQPAELPEVYAFVAERIAERLRQLPGAVQSPVGVVVVTERAEPPKVQTLEIEVTKERKPRGTH